MEEPNATEDGKEITEGAPPVPEETEKFDEEDEVDLSSLETLLLCTGDWDDRDDAMVETLALPAQDCVLSLLQAAQAPTPEQRLELLEAAADLGHTGACCKVGLAYQLGKGVEPNKAEAVRWFGKAAVQGCRFGAFYLGLCYQTGTGVPKDCDEAIKWHTKSAEAGHLPAVRHLGRLLQQRGELDAALQWWRVSAEQGDANAQVQTGALLEAQKSYSEALRWYEKASRQGLAEAQYRLGACLHYGRGSANLPEAARLYALAAEQNYPLAQYALSRFFQTGRAGMPQDKDLALEWLTKAASHGLAIAMVRVGGLHEEKGDGSTAAEWFRRAAETQDASGQYHFGRVLLFGKGITADPARAVLYFRHAARQGFAKAQRRLAVCLEQGKGVVRNTAKARRWYLAAAEQGDCEAMYCLAANLCNDLTGGGPEERHAKALLWFTKAADKQHPGALHDLGVLKYQGAPGIEKDLKAAQHYWRLAVCLGSKAIRDSAQTGLTKIERKRKRRPQSTSTTAR